MIRHHSLVCRWGIADFIVLTLPLGATRNKYKGVRRMYMLILLLKGLTGCSCKQASG